MVYGQRVLRICDQASIGKCLTPNTMLSASLSNCAYFISAGVSVCEAYAIGRSELSSNRFDKTAPTPYGEASHDSINGFMGL